jgi:hypothetical protein
MSGFGKETHPSSPNEPKQPSSATWPSFPSWLRRNSTESNCPQLTQDSADKSQAANAKGTELKTTADLIGDEALSFNADGTTAPTERQNIGDCAEGERSSEGKSEQFWTMYHKKMMPLEHQVEQEAAKNDPAWREKMIREFDKSGRVEWFHAKQKKEKDEK